MTFLQRMDCQFAILDAMISQWRSAKPNEITLTDRTPIDLVGYALSAVDSYAALTPAEDERLASYLSLCNMAMGELFDRVALLPMGKFEVNRDEDKIAGHMCFGNRMLLQTLMFGSLGQVITLPKVYVTTLEQATVEERIMELREFIGLTFNASLFE